MKRPRDRLQGKVYEHQMPYINSTRVLRNFGEVKFFAMEGAAILKLKRVTVEPARFNYFGEADVDTSLLRFNPKKETREGTVVHELAHLVVEKIHGHGVAFHGPEFMKVFVKLAAVFHSADQARLLEVSFRKILAP